MIRATIREYLKQVDWCVPENICWLIYGKFTKELENDCWSELEEMSRTKRVDALKRLYNKLYKVYAKHDTKKKDKGEWRIDHDIKLRNVIASLFNRTGVFNVSFSTYADMKEGFHYWEMDNGHMDRKQIKDKIKTHYADKGKVRKTAIFIMSHREERKELEQERLNMLFDIVREVIPDKPNRVLGACYTDYLINGKLYNYKEGR